MRTKRASTLRSITRTASHVVSHHLPFYYRIGTIQTYVRLISVLHTFFDTFPSLSVFFLFAFVIVVLIILVVVIIHNWSEFTRYAVIQVLPANHIDISK